MNKFFRNNWVSLLIWGLFGLFIGYILKISTYTIAYSNGLNKGYNLALDTVNSIMKEQIDSDTNHCTRLSIDTSYYYLKHKCNE